MKNNKSLILSTVLLLFCVTAVFGDSSSSFLDYVGSPDRFGNIPVMKDGCWGMNDSDGKRIIPILFDDIFWDDEQCLYVCCSIMDDGHPFYQFFSVMGTLRYSALSYSPSSSTKSISGINNTSNSSSTKTKPATKKCPVCNGTGKSHITHEVPTYGLPKNTNFDCPYCNLRTEHTHNSCPYCYGKGTITY